MALGDVDIRAVFAAPESPVLFTGRDNGVVLELTAFVPDQRRPTYRALELAEITRMVLVLLRTAPDATPLDHYTFDSAQVPGAVDWSAGGGVVELNLHTYDIPEGTYPVSLIAFDDAHPDGQVLLDPEVGQGCNLRVRNIEASGLTPPPVPDDGTGASVTREAGEALSALRVVYELDGVVKLLDPTDVATLLPRAPLGLTLGAAQVGGSVTLKQDGTVDDTGWSWTPGLVFVGPAGTLTQTAPQSGWEIVVGWAPSATRLNVHIDEPVLLG